MGREENNSTLGAQTARPTMSLDENKTDNGQNRVAVYAHADGVSVRAHADNTKAGSREEILAGARESASTAATMANAERDTNLAEAASQAAAEAEKRRATARAGQNVASARVGQTFQNERGSMTIDSVTAATAGSSMPDAVGASANPETVRNQQKQMAGSEHRTSKGIIAAIAVLAVATVIAVVCGIWYFAVYSQPEYVVADAFTKLISAERVQFSGLAISEAPVDESATSLYLGGNDTETETQQTTAEFLVKTGRNEGIGAAVDLTWSQSDSEAEYAFNVSAFLPQGGDLYASLSGVSDSLETYLGEIYNDESYLSLEEAMDVFPVLQVLMDLAEEVDGEWWTLSADDEGDEADLLQYSSCLIDALRKESVAKKISALYDEYYFMSAAEIGTNKVDVGNLEKAYTVSIDADKLSGFINSVYADIVYPNANTCLATSDLTADVLPEPSSDGVIVEADDLAEVTEAFQNMIFVINNVNHRLTNFYYQYEDDETQTDVAVGIEVSYPSAITITLPEESSPFSSFFQSLQEVFGLKTDVNEEGLYLEYDEAEIEAETEDEEVIDVEFPDVEDLSEN